MIQNEYTSANIDTTELYSPGRKFEVLEINNGSVFCICQLANFIDSAADFIRECQPGMIILEASGLSDPIAVAELLQHEKLQDHIYLAHVWTIVDAVNFNKVIQMADRLKRQIMISDTLVINKVDSGEQNLPGIHERLAALNPDAVRIESSYCNIRFETIEDLIIGDPLALILKKQHGNMIPLDRAIVNTVVLKTTFKISEIRLRRFLKEVENKVIRMKGFVNLDSGQTLRIQSVFGVTNTVQVYHYTGPTEMIGIGFNITAADFGKKFHSCRKA